MNKCIGCNKPSQNKERYWQCKSCLYHEYEELELLNKWVSYCD